MSTPPNDPTDSTTPKPANPLGPEGKMKVAQFRSRSGVLAVVLAIVTVATIVFILWNLPSRFSQWDTTGWVFTIAVALAGTLIVLMLIWKIPKWQVDRYRSRLMPKDEVELEIQSRSTLVQIIGGVAVLASIFFTAENLSLTAKNVETTQETLKYARETQIAERYSKAIDHLKSTDVEVRLAGIYALEILAKQNEFKDFRRPIMLVLAANIKNRSSLVQNYDPDTLQAIPPDIQAILTVIGKHKDPALKLDLHGTNLMNADLQDGQFGNVDFSGCYLAAARFDRAQLGSVNLANAKLYGAVFDAADMQSANLEGARLVGTSLIGTKLQGSRFKLALVQDAVFDKAQLDYVDFNYASGNGGYFEGAELKGSSGVNPAWIKDQPKVD